MSFEMKDQMMCIAEDIAQAEFDKEFYDLSTDQQAQVWARAEEAWTEGRIAQGEQE